MSYCGTIKRDLFLKGAIYCNQYLFPSNNDMKCITLIGEEHKETYKGCKCEKIYELSIPNYISILGNTVLIESKAGAEDKVSTNSYNLNLISKLKDIKIYGIDNRSLSIDVNSLYYSEHLTSDELYKLFIAPLSNILNIVKGYNKLSIQMIKQLQSDCTKFTKHRSQIDIKDQLLILRKMWSNYVDITIMNYISTIPSKRINILIGFRHISNLHKYLSPYAVWVSSENETESNCINLLGSMDWITCGRDEEENY